MGFSVPNAGDAAFGAQARLSAGDLDALSAAHSGTGVVSGCGVTAQGSPDMTVAVEAGVLWFNRVPVPVTAGNVTITAAHATFGRIDLIVASSSGAKSATAGTPSAIPLAPAVPAASVLLAAVFVPAADTAINANQIIDKRVAVSMQQDRTYDLGTGRWGVWSPDATATVNTATGAAAIAAAAAAGGGRVFVPRDPQGRRFKMTRTDVADQKKGCFHLLPGVQLDSDGASIELSGNCAFITARSTFGASTVITADTTATTTSLTVTSSAGFAIGDTVFIRIGQASYDAAEPDHWLYALVTDIPDGTHITLDQPVGYALTVASVADTNQRNISKVAGLLDNLRIGDFDFYAPAYPAANAEAGVQVQWARNLKIGRLSGYNVGAGIIVGQFIDDIVIEDLAVHQSEASNGQTSKGRGINIGECRNIRIGNALLEKCERTFVLAENRTENFRIENLYVKNTWPGRSTTSMAVLFTLQKAAISIGTFRIDGNPSYIHDQGGTTGNTLSIDHAFVRTSGSAHSNLYCDRVMRTLAVDGVTYDTVRTWSKVIPLTPSMSGVVFTLPSGFLKSCRVFSSSVTGIASFALRSSVSTASAHAQLVAGSTVSISNVGSLVLNHNAGPAKSIAISTDGTVVAGAYLVVEVEYFEDVTGTQAQTLPPGDVPSYLQLAEIADPAAPAANFGRLYVRDNGSGKSQICVRFPTGVVQVLATEP
jgi:hypothetical protein